MEKNIKEKISNCNLKSAKGITLVALVVTIIVLLILASVSLSAVFSQDGIFSRAEQATGKYGQAKARETLELAFGNLQAEKYEARLTAERLDARITEEIGKMGGEEIGDDKSEVIVDGYRFTVDRTVPKIVEELGPADGVIISASITQNKDWSNPKATVTGLIKTYSGGTITSSTAEVIKGNVDVSSFPTTGGNFTIANITEDTDIKITATDSNKKTNTRTIHVVLVRDNTPPVISNAKAEATLMKITISADVADPESGITSFTYNVTGVGTVTPAATGTLTTGVPLELTTSTPGNYTVTFTATNGAGNTVTTEGIIVTTSDAISIADLKSKINVDNYPDYIGTKVDYNPEAGGTWRVFYYDASGEFGDGAGTIYLKRDYDNTKTMTLSDYVSSGATENGEAMMKQLNTLWAKSDNGKKARENYLDNEKAVAGLCDTNNWTTYKTVDAKYAIGAAPIEMWCKAQNAYKNKYDTSADTIGCGIQNANGYGYTINGGSLKNASAATVVSNTNIPQSATIAISSYYQWLASPSSNYDYYVCFVNSTYVTPLTSGTAYGICPVVSLDH